MYVECAETATPPTAEPLDEALLKERRRALRKQDRDARSWGRPQNTFVRRAELYRVLNHRWGGWLPNDKAGRDALFAIAVADLRCGATEVEVTRGLKRTAPWLMPDEVPAIMQRARECTRIGRGLGKLVGLSEAERVACKAWRLQSIDGPTPAEAKLQRERSNGREGRRRRRASEGAVTRAVYIANALTTTRPWEAEKVSRRTWERRRAKASRVASAVSQVRPSTYTSPRCVGGLATVAPELRPSLTAQADVESAHPPVAAGASHILEELVGTTGRPKPSFPPGKPARQPQASSFPEPEAAPGAGVQFPIRWRDLSGVLKELDASGRVERVRNAEGYA